jgi:hypothetical protein
MPRQTTREAIRELLGYALLAQTEQHNQQHNTLLEMQRNSSLSSLSSMSDLARLAEESDSVSSFSSISSSSSSDSDSGSGVSSVDFEEDANEAAAISEALLTLESSFLLFCKGIFDMDNFIERTRVLFPHQVPKNSSLPLVITVFKVHDPKRFRSNLRCDPSTFDFLHELICDHEVFQNNSPLASQVPPIFQLAIYLYRMGHFGNAATPEKIGQWAGCSVGLVVKSTRRVIRAFADLHDRAVHWPSSVEKREASDWIEAHSCRGWRPGYAMVDGTLIPLFARPGHFGNLFFDRKMNYSLGLQVIFIA